MPERRSLRSRAGDPYAARVPVPGSRVGDWSLEHEVGRGTTAVVFAATHVTDGRHAALKLALPGTLENEAAVARFLRGAEAQRSLAHPGALPVWDSGTDPLAGPYLVTPLVGPPLSTALAAGDSLRPARSRPCAISPARSMPLPTPGSCTAT